MCCAAYAINILSFVGTSVFGLISAVSGYVIVHVARDTVFSARITGSLFQTW